MEACKRFNKESLDMGEVGHRFTIEYAVGSMGYRFIERMGTNTNGTEPQLEFANVY
jgi:hypothetical protein